MLPESSIDICKAEPRVGKPRPD